MSKYAPADTDGNKPYIITISDWGKDRTVLEYAPTPVEARSRHSRRGVGQYVKGVRRATTEDVGGAT